MSKFTFICEDDDGAVFTATQERDDLDIVLEDFQNFLRGCGYYFDGNIAIVDEEGSDVESDKANWPNDNFIRTHDGYIVPSPFNYSKDLPNRNPKE